MDTQRTPDHRHGQPGARRPSRTLLILSTLLLVLGACGGPETGRSAAPAAPPEEARSPVPYPPPSPSVVTERAEPIIYDFFPANRLCVVVDAQMTVLHVEPHSAAAQAGIQPGDVLQTVDGISFAEQRAAARARIAEKGRTQPEVVGPPQPGTAAPEAGQPVDSVPITLERAGSVLQVAVIPAIPPPSALTPTPVTPPDDYL